MTRETSFKYRLADHIKENHIAKRLGEVDRATKYCTIKP